MALPLIRTLVTKNNDAIPAVVPATKIAPQNFYRKKQVKFICPHCALEYCPNFLQYARLDTPIAASFLDIKQHCDICGGYGKYAGGVTDPANYGGIATIYAQ